MTVLGRAGKQLLEEAELFRELAIQTIFYFFPIETHSEAANDQNNHHNKKNMAFSCTEMIRRRRRGSSISRFTDNLNDSEDQTRLCLTVNSSSVKPTCLPNVRRTSLRIQPPPPPSSTPDAPPTLRENNKSRSNSQKLMAHLFYCGAPQLQPISFPHRESFAFLTEHSSKCYTQCVQQRFPAGPAHTRHVQPVG